MKVHVIIFLAVVLVLLVYWPMVAPSVAPQGDSGELVTVAYTLGVAHPPGYPLYTLFAHLFTLLPWGSVAWRVNLFSTVLQVVTLYFIGLIAHRSTRSLLATLGVILAMAFSYTFWLYALVAEVFPLNNLLVVLIIYFSLFFADKNWFWPVLALLFGLGLANHHTVVLVLPALWYLLHQRIGRRNLIKITLKCAPIFVLGLSAYLYFYFRREASVPVAWRFPQNLVDIGRLFFRVDYGTFAAVANVDPALVSLGEKAQQAVNYWRFLLDDFGPLGMFLALLGFLVGIVRRQRITIFIFLGWLFSGVVFLTYAAFPIAEATGTGLEVVERFYLLPNIFFALAIGLGISFLIGRLRKFALLRVLPAAVVIFCVGILILVHYNLVNQKNNYLAFNLGKNVLSGALHRSLILLQGDVPTFATLYVRYVENYRTDVELVTPNLLTPDNRLRYLKRVRPDLELNSVASPQQLVKNTYLSTPVYHFGLPGQAFSGITATPSGLLFRFYPPDTPLDPEIWKAGNKDVLGAYNLPSDADLRNRSTLGDKVVIGFYPQMFNFLGNYCLTTSRVDCAISNYNQALVYDPGNFWGNVGNARAFALSGKCSQAEEIFKKYNLVDDLINLAESCFKDDVKTDYYLNQKNTIEERQGGDLKNL